MISHLYQPDRRSFERPFLLDFADACKNSSAKAMGNTALKLSRLLPRAIQKTRCEVDDSALILCRKTFANFAKLSGRKGAEFTILSSKIGGASAIASTVVGMAIWGSQQQAQNRVASLFPSERSSQYIVEAEAINHQVNTALGALAVSVDGQTKTGAIIEHVNTCPSSTSEQSPASLSLQSSGKLNAVPIAAKIMSLAAQAHLPLASMNASCSPPPSFIPTGRLGAPVAQRS